MCTIITCNTRKLHQIVGSNGTNIFFSFVVYLNYVYQLNNIFTLFYYLFFVL